MIRYSKGCYNFLTVFLRFNGVYLRYNTAKKPQENPNEFIWKLVFLVFYIICFSSIYHFPRSLICNL